MKKFLFELYMNTLLNATLSEELSNDDIKDICPNAKIMLYEDLQDCNTIFDAIGPTNVMILLFPVASNHNGHWTAVLYHPSLKLVEHFDSYGLSPAQEMGYTNNQYVKEQLLNNLYKKAIYDGYKVKYNEIKLQQMKHNVADCGRWASVRGVFGSYTNDAFGKLFMNQKLDPDSIICLMTLLYTL